MRLMSERTTVADCLAEFCTQWTGDGCICRVPGLTPEEATHDDGCGCKSCYDAKGEAQWDASLY